MNTNGIGRRKIILTAAGAGLSTLLCSRVSGEPTPSETPDATLLAEEAGDLHSRLLEQTGKFLNGESITTKTGLQNLAKGVVELNRMDEDHAVQLQNLIESIFQSQNLNELQRKIEDFYGGVKNSVESAKGDAEKIAANIVLAIVSIARDSVTFVTKLAAQAPFRKVLDIVAADVGGALTGAGAIPVFLKAIPIPQLAPVIRGVCIIAGAGGASATVAFPIPKG
jgi:hypothetical protein